MKEGGIYKCTLGYKQRWDELRSPIRIKERCQKIKEDLLAEVWHPRRVERLVERYGLEVLEAL
jgi:hypothetical protein